VSRCRGGEVSRCRGGEVARWRGGELSRCKGWDGAPKRWRVGEEEQVGRGAKVSVARRFARIVPFSGLGRGPRDRIFACGASKKPLTRAFGRIKRRRQRGGREARSRLVGLGLGGWGGERRVVRWREGLGNNETTAMVVVVVVVVVAAAAAASKEDGKKN
jgi:hypothetical protein